jgi:hypothetical protein
MTATCRNCGAAVGRLAASCGRCGAPNAARRMLFATAAAVLVLAAAAAVAAILALRDPSRGLLAGLRIGTSGARDYAWLSKVMKDCDDEAAKDKATLHFLVIPLRADAAQQQSLRSLTVNTMGNAIIISGEDTLRLLRAGTVAILQDPYVFSIRDEATKVVYRWDQATSVKWVSSKDDGAVRRFRMQIRPQGQGSGEALPDAWGNAIARQDGNCYWVNALIAR